LSDSGWTIRAELPEDRSADNFVPEHVMAEMLQDETLNAILKEDSQSPQ